MDRYRKLGIYFGYPQCCVNWFCDRNEGKVNFELDKNQEILNEYKGFLPCPCCAEKLVKQNKTVKFLIKNRICKTPYPDEGDFSEILLYLNEY